MQKLIKNGVYNLMVNDLYLYYYKRNISLFGDFKSPNTFFRIKKLYKNNNTIFYNIEEYFTKNKLIVLDNKIISFIKKKSTSNLWIFIEINNNSYIIQNKEKCYLKLEKSNIICDFISFEKASQFKLIKIFSERNEKNNYNYINILNKEPIDILIKYIDLSDPDLKRNHIHQIDKDYDNEELRYSIRSILINIPWIRKIYILMPNEKIRYFKEYNLIKDKIIYLKDKDLLGYDSSNSNAFQFRYWKLKKYGISNNIIVMDDDCFIGKSLEKQDFFYVKNGKVFPYIITSNFLKIDKKTVENNCIIYKNLAKYSKEEQNDDIFNYSKYLTYLFVLNIFNISYNENIFIPKFTHNAIPVNLQDIREIYDLTYKSIYKYNTLDCNYRNIGYLQFQMFILSYTFLKYNRKVRDIPYKYISINNSISANYNIALFCINKGAGYYSFINLYKEKIAMEYLFPKPTPYEILDYSFINLSFNIVYNLDKELKILENQFSHNNSTKELLLIILLFTFFIFLILVNIKYTNLFEN